MHNFLSFPWVSGWADFASLILRVATGAIFMMHGWSKFQGGTEGVAGMLGGLGFPMPEVFAVILIAVELLGGILLILGALTRWAAFLAGIVALVAYLMVHMSQGWSDSEFVILLFAACVALLALGGGRYSLDRAWFRI